MYWGRKFPIFQQTGSCTILTVDIMAGIESFNLAPKLPSKMGDYRFLAVNFVFSNKTFWTMKIYLKTKIWESNCPFQHDTTMY